MITIIAGSRGLRSKKMFDDSIIQCPWSITEVVSGGALGIDSLGEEWAKRMGLPLKRFPVSKADWKMWGRRAGRHRNEHMARYAEACFAIWDGASHGTRHMIEHASDMGLRVHVIRWQ